MDGLGIADAEGFAGGGRIILAIGKMGCVAGYADMEQSIVGSQMFDIDLKLAARANARQQSERCYRRPGFGGRNCPILCPCGIAGPRTGNITHNYPYSLRDAADGDLL